jgi:hypothetical protein
MRHAFAAGLVALSAAYEGSAATLTFIDRPSFEAQLGQSITDTYDGYTSAGVDLTLSNHDMTEVKGETTYETTGHLNNNRILSPTPDDHFYCAGCNGTFRMNFSATSLTDEGSGVFGVGFDYSNGFREPAYSAYVTFGDGSQANYELASTTAEPCVVGNCTYPTPLFFGLTSEKRIADIHISVQGATSRSGFFYMDDLTIGAAIPEPRSWAFMILGFGAAGAVLRRRRTALAG